MSIPSSSDAVATSALSFPSLSRVSASRRFSLERLPWCDVTWSAPLQTPAGEVLEPFERQRQVAPPLVARHGVDLVHDHGAYAAQHLAGALGCEDEIEGLGRGDENMRGPPHHLLALRARRVAGPHQRADLHIRQAQRFERTADPGERLRQILLDVVGERLERRDVHDLRAVRDRALEALTQE